MPDSEIPIRKPYSSLTKSEKEVRVKALWKKAYLKSKGSAYIIRKFKFVNREIFLYGTKKN